MNKKEARVKPFKKYIQILLRQSNSCGKVGIVVASDTSGSNGSKIVMSKILYRTCIYF